MTIPGPKFAQGNVECRYHLPVWNYTHQMQIYIQVFCFQSCACVQIIAEHVWFIRRHQDCQDLPFERQVSPGQPGIPGFLKSVRTAYCVHRVELIVYIVSQAAKLFEKTV